MVLFYIQFIWRAFACWEKDKEGEKSGRKRQNTHTAYTPTTYHRHSTRALLRLPHKRG